MDIFTKAVNWKELAPLPVCRAAHTAVLLGGVIYVGAGLEDRNSVFQGIKGSYRLDIYNLTTNQWSPNAITTPCSLFAMTVLDDELLIAGGRTKNTEAVKKVFCLNSGQWKDYSEMPTAISCATAVGYHSTLIVVGGLTKVHVKGEWIKVATTELLDTTNGCWYTCNNLPSPHQQQLATISNRKLYVSGGFNENHEISSQVFFTSLNNFSTHQLSWQSAPNTPWYGSAPVVLYNKFLLTVGGKQQSRTSEVNVYNDITGKWKLLTNIPAARSGTAVVGVGDNMIVIGGSIADKKFSNTVWIGRFE